MKTKLALSAVAAAVALFSQGAFAQASSPTRADVKAQAKTGPLAPAGQGPGQSGKDNVPNASSKTRMERKDETKDARASGQLQPAGDAADLKKDVEEKKKNTGSMTTRADRKATTRAAVKSGGTQPAGEAAQPSGEMPKK